VTTTARPAETAPLDPYVVGGLAMAAMLVAVYIGLRARRRREWPDVGDVISVVATSTGVIAGVRLAVVAVSADDLGPFQSQDRIFIPLAGVTLILVSSRLIYATIREGIRPRP
jgi:hypothetical protein